MSSQCLMSLNFNHNSFVGLDQNEIENCTLEDLKYLRKEIKRYLMKIGLKKRNRNFVEVFLRINKEIKRRKLGYPNIFQVAKTKYDPSSSINEDPTEDSSRKNSYINIPSCNTPFHDPKESETRDELVIPEFFNDKCTSPTKALSVNQECILMRSQLDIAKPPMLMSEDLYWTENNMECCFNEYEVNFILKDNNYPIRQEDFEIPLDIL